MAERRGALGRGRVRLPSGLGQRIKLSFALFAALVAPISGLGLLVEGAPLVPDGLVAIAALLVATGWAWCQYRRDGLPWWADPVPLVALIVAAGAIGAPSHVRGLLFVLLFGRMLYGSGLRLWANAAGYFVAYEAAVLLVEGAGRDLVAMVSIGLGVAFSAGVMAVVGRVVREHESLLRREGVLARTGSRLQSAEDHEAVYTVAEEMGLELLGEVPGAVLTFWHGDTERIRLRHQAGPLAPDTPLEVPMAQLPEHLRDRMLSGETVHLDRDAMREVQRAVRMEATYAAMMAAPLLRGGEFSGVLAVASRQQVPCTLATAFGRLATDVGLALDRADSRELLHGIVESSSDAIVLLDHEHVVRFASTAAERLFAASAPELVGRGFHDLLGLEDQQAAAALLREAGGTAEGSRIDVPGRAGGQRQLGIAAAPTPDARGQGWVVNLRDVSQRVAHERELQRSEARFRSLAEHVTEGIYQMSLHPEPRYEYVNPAMEAMSGFPAEAFLADPDLTARQIHPDDLAVVRRTREAPDEVAFPVELRWRRRTGEWLWIALRETVLHDEAGRAVATVGTFSDITARRQQQQALEGALERERRATERLRRVDAMRTMFIQAVSHELRTPLTAITGYAKTLRRHHDEIERTMLLTLLERLDFNASKLDRLLADLLDVDRLSSQVLAPDRRPVDVLALARDVVDQIEITSHPVSCTGEQVVAEVDGPKVERILENLVRNAIKHTAVGTPITVEVVADEAGDGVVLTVHDEGRGIAEELLEQVFDPFVQGQQSAAAPSPGMGIGLSLVARFAELHGGRARVSNRPEGGAAFEVWLPGPRAGRDGAGDDGPADEGQGTSVRTSTGVS